MKFQLSIVKSAAIAMAVASLATATFAQTIPTSLVMGIDPHFRPMSFAGTDGKVIGFDVEMAEELGKRLKATVTIDGMAFDGIIPALQGKRIDLTEMVVTPQRQ